MMTPEGFADTIASFEAFDFNVCSIALNPKDFDQFATSAKDILHISDGSTWPGPEVIIVGIPRATLWSIWITTSESIPLGKMLALPNIEALCVPECGASFRLAPFIECVSQAAKAPHRGRGSARMRTQEDYDGMVRDMGPHPSVDQMHAWMDRKYPNG